MKAKQAFALMAALALGVAAAEGTPAGTQITNVAVATFDNPADGTQASSSSNTVTTTVLPRPDFDVVYRNLTDGTTATSPVGEAAGQIPSANVGERTPGQTLVTPYIIQNNGNVNGQSVTLAASTAGSPTALPTENVAYYVDNNGDGAQDAGDTLISGPVSVPVDDPATAADEGILNIIQVITVPSDAPAGAQYAASPVATSDRFDPATSTTSTVTETDLQFSRVTVYTPSLTTAPVDGTPGDGTQDPPTTNVTPPGSTPVPGYVDPLNPNNIVAVTADGQNAYPKSDADANPDTANFTGSVTNGGTLPETVNLFPTTTTGPGGAPIGQPNAEGYFSVPQADGTTALVRFLDSSGNPLPIGPDGYPVLTVAPGETANYITQVVYPDPDSNPANNPSAVQVIVGVDSLNDAGVAAEDTTTNTVFPAQLQFGDSTTGLGTDPTPATNQTVIPGTTSLVPGNNSDGSAIFPMDVYNAGEYADTFTLSGSVVLPVNNADGTTSDVTVPVRYFIDSNGDGTPDTEITTTPLVQPNQELKVFAVVDVPANAARTTTPATVTQTATGDYSTVTRQDNNNTITVGLDTSKNVAVTKAVSLAEALPGQSLSYTITAKNNFNTSVPNLIVTESNTNTSTNVFTYTTFQSVTATKTFTAGTILYRFNSGSWQTSATPTGAAADVTRVDVGVDTNGDGTISSADLFPASGQLDVTMNVLVK